MAQQVAKEQQLGPPPGGVAKALLVSSRAGGGSGPGGVAAAAVAAVAQPGAGMGATDTGGVGGRPGESGEPVESVEERLARCSTASAFEQVLLSLQPDDMWDNVGAIYRELQWCTVVIMHLPDAALKAAMARGACSAGGGAGG